MSKSINEIRSRDPFVLVDSKSGNYYLYVSTVLNNAEEGFDCFRSRDLVNWDGPIAAFRPPAGFWGTQDFWAPEVHCYRDRYYLFATFKTPDRYRGTQIMMSDSPEGPFAPITDGPVTPADWECLDGTFYLDSDEKPWIIFCHEWTQVHNGGMWAMPLCEDLTKASGRPVFLFNASEAPWKSKKPWLGIEAGYSFPTYVTDGPFIHRTTSGKLLMIWSSFGDNDYAVGIARSESNEIRGPWTQDKQPLYSKDGGHAMIFRAFNDKLHLALHAPNRRGDEKANFFEIEDDGNTLKLVGDVTGKPVTV